MALNPFRRRPACPVRPVEQDWIEGNLDWLRSAFGAERLHGEVLLPTEAHFPGAYAGTPGEVEAVVYRLSRHMGVDPARIEVEHGDPGDDPALSAHVPLHTSSRGAAGHYRRRAGRPVVSIRRDLATRPMALVATVAHELGHVLLLGDGRIDPARADHEALTDLLTVYFGTGVFAANAAVTHTTETRGAYTYTSHARLGYLTEPMYGYALARYAWLRGEPRPPWSAHLTANPRAVMRQGLRYLSAS